MKLTTKMHLKSCLVLLLMIWNGVSAQTALPIQKTSLFNGKDLTNWYTFVKNRGKDIDPLGVFTVKDGMIRISGEEYGCITTNEEYENYVLTVEFKWGDETFAPREDKTKDSGVLLHSKGKDGGYSGTWMNSIESQIIEGGTGDFIVVGDGTTNYSITAKVAPEKSAGSYIYHPDGQPVTINGGRINWYARDVDWADKLGFRGARDVEKPDGEWNKMECIAVGDKIYVYLNDVLVNEAYQVKPSQGRIQIQSEGAEMFVRKVEISPLSEDEIVSIHANDGTGVGPKIKIMPEWNAFGYFTADDHIEWQAITVPKTAKYDVYLDWSVSDDSAGNPYILKVGKSTVHGTVQKSGAWEEFRTIKVGSIKLKKGTHKASFKPNPKLAKGGMLDYREIKLIPRR